MATQAQKSVTKQVGKWVLIIFANFSIFTGAGKVIWDRFILPDVKLAVHDEINEYYSNRKGSLSNTMSKGLRVDRELVGPILIKLHSDFYSTRDSINNFVKIYSPILGEESKYINVGLYYDKRTRVMKYLHKDGQMYRATQNEQGVYYFLNQDDTWELCR